MSPYSENTWPCQRRGRAQISKPKYQIVDFDPLICGLADQGIQYLPLITADIHILYPDAVGIEAGDFAFGFKGQHLIRFRDGEAQGVRGGCQLCVHPAHSPSDAPPPPRTYHPIHNGYHMEGHIR